MVVTRNTPDMDAPEDGAAAQAPAAAVSSSEIALHLIELLNDDQMLAKMKRALFPQVLSDKIDSLQQQVASLTTQLQAKDERIAALEQKLQEQELLIDQAQQYSRRPNLRIAGIPEPGPEGECTDAKVLELVNGKLQVNPPLELHQIERSHRLGPGLDDRGNRRTRDIIVRFGSERVRDMVYRARTRLKDYNAHNQGAKIYINEDLTKYRGKLISKCRQLKKASNLLECWTWLGNVVIKTNDNVIKGVQTIDDLRAYGYSDAN